MKFLENKILKDIYIGEEHMRTINKYFLSPDRFFRLSRFGKHRNFATEKEKNIV